MDYINISNKCILNYYINIVYDFNINNNVDIYRFIIDIFILGLINHNIFIIIIIDNILYIKIYLVKI